MLSNDAIRILKSIHERGLKVRMSFKVAYPEYDDGEEMPRADWYIAERELWRVVEKEEIFECDRQEYIERKVVRSGGVMTEQVLVASDGRELPMGSTAFEFSSSFTPGADGEILSERRWVEADRRLILSRRWKSDYIRKEHIETDDYSEEFVGMADRYLLTDKALEIIASA